MKWCCSRYTSGIVIGSIYIVGSITFLIFACLAYLEYKDAVDDEYHHWEKLKAEAIKTMIICGIAALISALFIVAIAKRYEYLILPWLILGIFCFYETCVNMYWWFIGAAMGGASVITFLILLLIAVLAFGSQIAIFIFSCSLFKQIHQENKDNAVLQLSDPLADRSFI
ncbi:uncharacterized protein LOC111686982 [Lucilia cuprina]|uniref:uncharacterized protein LOC111686982 n=1 Tax=Lucilia cuprina TaxID=7375 RepID=UPI001F05137B|nr:uncharacterized protein LOC111686982 [Lucilia cuprina]